MERLLSHHQHSVFSILPHIFIHVEGRYWHVDPTRQKLHLNQKMEGINIAWFMELTFRVHRDLSLFEIFSLNDKI